MEKVVRALDLLLLSRWLSKSNPEITRHCLADLRVHPITYSKIHDNSNSLAYVLLLCPPRIFLDGGVSGTPSKSCASIEQKTPAQKIERRRKRL